MYKCKIYAFAATSRLFSGLFIVLVTVFFTGCGSAIYGRLENSPEVTQVFKNGKILSNHQYYVSGFQRVPYAIIAIDSKYQLRAGRWQPLDLDSTALNQIIYDSSG